MIVDQAMVDLEKGGEVFKLVKQNCFIILDL